jgi:hypothetical protein
MAKAEIVLGDGTKVTIEGTADEVAVLVSKFSGDAKSAPKSAKKSVTKTKKASVTKAKYGLGDLIAELIDGGFFKKPKELGAIRVALEEQGHYYPATTLSPALLRLVRRKQLRRVKDKKRWMYVG